MKAVVLHEYGPPKNLKYEDMPDPKPAQGEVLVRIAATSVNPVDFKMRSGAAKEHFPVQFPGILGRDIAGIVRELGPGVTSFQPGDKVIALGSRTYAELATVKASDLTLLPKGLDLVEAAALPLVTLTGEQLITRGTKIKPGQTVLVTGAVGAVGRSAVWTAKKAGATVIAGVRKSQLKAAAELKADIVLAVADTVGGETANALLVKVKQGGTFASVLGPPTDAKMHPTINIAPVVCVPDAATRAQREYQRVEEGGYYNGVFHAVRGKLRFMHQGEHEFRRPAGVQIEPAQFVLDLELELRRLDA